MTSISNFPNGLASFGTVLPAGLGVPTQGQTYFVKPHSGSDENTGTSPQFAFATLAQAKAAAVAGQNDTVYLMSESNTASSTTDYQSAAFAWSKDAVHLIGVGSTPMIGQRARIAELSTVKGIADLFTVSANNCVISGIEVFQGVASSTATGRAVVVSGQRNRIVNSQFSGNGDTAGSSDDAGARSLAVSGSENLFQHCYLGLDTVVRATQAYEVEVIGTSGAKAARNIFEDCLINTYTSNTAFVPVAVSYVDRFVMFKNCTVSAVQGITSSAIPLAGIVTANMNGKAILHGTSFFGCANVTAAGDSTVYISGFGPGAIADTGLANATVIA